MRLFRDTPLGLAFEVESSFGRSSYLFDYFNGTVLIATYFCMAIIIWRASSLLRRLKLGP